MTRDSFTYRIDNTDTIVSVSDNWGSFADANAWSSSLRPENVVGHKLWDFIQDIETRHLYQEVFKRARRGTPCRAIPFRCDSPTERRYLKLVAKALSDGSIHITSTILRTEPRSSVSLLEENTPRSTDMVTVCSMCKKIKVAPRQWAEIEEGLALLRLFEAEEMPRLTHGLCHPCYQAAIGELDDMETPNNAIDSDEE
jgi:hypothetical protein